MAKAALPDGPQKQSGDTHTTLQLQLITPTPYSSTPQLLLSSTLNSRLFPLKHKPPNLEQVLQVDELQARPNTVGAQCAEVFQVNLDVGAPPPPPSPARRSGNSNGIAAAKPRPEVRQVPSCSGTAAAPRTAERPCQSAIGQWQQKSSCAPPPSRTSQFENFFLETKFLHFPYYFYFHLNQYDYHKDIYFFLFQKYI